MPIQYEGPDRRLNTPDRRVGPEDLGGNQDRRRNNYGRREEDWDTWEPCGCPMCDNTEGWDDED